MITMLFIIGIVSVVAWHQYSLLEDTISAFSDETLPLINVANNLAKASKDLSSKTQALLTTRDSKHLKTRALFLRLASEKLGQTLRQVQGSLPNAATSNSLRELHKQLTENTQQLVTAIEQRHSIQDQIKQQEEKFISMEKTISDVLIDQLQLSSNPELTNFTSAQYAWQKRHRWEMLSTIHVLSKIIRRNADHFSNLSEIDRLEEEYYLHTKRLSQLAQRVSEEENSHDLVSLINMIQAVGIKQSGFFDLQRRTYKLAQANEYYLKTNSRLSSQFSALTAAVVAAANNQAEASNQVRLQQVYTSRMIIIVVFIFAFSVALVTVWFLGRKRITKPLLVLVNAAQSIEYGDLTVTAAEEGAGEIRHLAKTFNRMTKRIRDRETELNELHRLLQQVQDSISSALITVDHDGLVMLCNRQAETLCQPIDLGWKDRPVIEAFPLLEKIWGSIKTVLAGTSSSGKLLISHKIDDREYLYEASIFSLELHGHSSAVVRLDDVTEQAHIEEMLIQSEKMISLGGVAAGIAHEINNPLAGVLQSAQVLKNRLDSKLPKNSEAAIKCNMSMESFTRYIEQRNIDTLIQTILDSGNRAANIVNNMLSFSRKSESQMTRQSLAQLVDKAVELAGNDFDLKNKFDFRSIAIVREYDQNLPDIICDGPKIQQVVLNLLKNSAQAMIEPYSQEQSPCITIVLAKEGGSVKLEVSDNGAGMDDETCRRIFEPFFTTKDTGYGTGLGLSVSYFIITKNHHGTMTVKSNLGQGTHFFIHLPLTQ